MRGDGEREMDRQRRERDGKRERSSHARSTPPDPCSFLWSTRSLTTEDPESFDRAELQHAQTDVPGSGTVTPVVYGTSSPYSRLTALYGDPSRLASRAALWDRQHPGRHNEMLGKLAANNGVYCSRWKSSPVSGALGGLGRPLCPAPVGLLCCHCFLKEDRHHYSEHYLYYSDCQNYCGRSYRLETADCLGRAFPGRTGSVGRRTLHRLEAGFADSMGAMHREAGAS